MKDGENKSDQLSFDVIRHIGVISDKKKGWKKELNIISWNGNPEKYDIRDWSKDHEYMSKGQTLDKKELKSLFELIEKEAI